MKVIPIKNKFFFQFEDAATRMGFHEKTVTGIVVPSSFSNVDKARWAHVIAIGKDVTEFAVGDVVLIENLQWTPMQNFDDVRFWISDQSKVVGVRES